MSIESSISAKVHNEMLDEWKEKLETAIEEGDLEKIRIIIREFKEFSFGE